MSHIQENTPAKHPAVLLVYVTCPDTTVAQRMAEALIASHYAACVSIVPGIQSTYRWQGAVETDEESLLLIKTTRDRLNDVQSCVNERHPDELPELIAVEVKDGSPDYLDWVVNETRQEPDSCG